MKKLEIGRRAPDFVLPGVDGKDYSLAKFKGKQVVVIVFICNHCPYIHAYEDRLLSLQRTFAPRGVQFIAVNPNDSVGYPEDGFDNMVKRAARRSYNFPYLRDETQRTARAYGARYTPEAFVLNSRFQVRYIGRIDDNWRHPAKVKSHDLRSAIEAILAHKKVENPVTHAIGSIINWKL